MDKNTVRLVERYQWPLALAFWCFLVSLCFEFPIHPRPRAIALKKPADLPMPTTKLQTAAASILIAGLLFGLPPPAFGADALPPPSAALSQIVGRVSALPSPSARDWADLARETVSWGSRVKSEQHAVPEGPVHDALSAVALGSKLDTKTTDWPKLREQLEALLKKDDDQKDQQQQQDKNKDQQQQQDQDQKQQSSDQKNQNQNQQSQQDKPEKGDSKNSNANPADNSQKKEGDDNKDGESAFGDMKKHDQPPAQEGPPPETQKVGGNQDDKKQAEPVDPSLAIPLQKLDQIRSQDSPARLFQLMEGERKPEKKATKDW